METTLDEILRTKGGRVCHVKPEANVLEAAQLMKHEKIGALLVLQGEKILGILTERDMLHRVVAEGIDPAATKVHEVMTKDVVVLKPSLTVREAMQIVSDKRTRHLPVVQDGHLLGMISSGDLTYRAIAEEGGVIHTLYDYIYGAYPA